MLNEKPNILYQTKKLISFINLFGVTRPSLGRVIRELDQDGYIIATGQHIKILNRKKLSDLLK